MLGRQVTGRDIEGRKVVVVGESSNSLALADDVGDADVIVHAASCKVHFLTLQPPRALKAGIWPPVVPTPES